MKKEIKLIRLKDRILGLALFLSIVKTFLSINMYVTLNGSIDNILSCIIAFLFAIDIIFQKYSIRTLLVYLGIAIFTFFLCYYINSFQILLTVLTILAIRKTDFTRVIKFIFQYECTFTILLIIFSVFCQFLFDMPIYIVKEGVTRFCFGFVHPNLFSIMLANLLLMWVWINYEYIKLGHFIILIVLEVVLYTFSKTRTAFYIMIILILLIALLYKKNNSRLFSYISGLSFPAVGVFWCVLFSTYRGSGFYNFFDTILSGRLRLAAYAYNTVGYTWFGSDVLPILKKVEWDPVYYLNDYTFDSLYSELFMNIGIVTFVLLCVLFFVLSMKRNNKINIFILAFSLYSITEVHTLNGYIFFPIFLLTFLLKDLNFVRIKDRILR